MAKQIRIYGTIGYDWWTGGGITSEWFARELDTALASKGDVEVLINTPGGDVFEGIHIYNLIAKNKDRITTVNEGVAYSMGAVIFLAGGNRKAYKNSTLLIHNVSGGVWGNAQTLRGALETMEKLDGALAESLAQFSGKTVDQVTKQYLNYQDHTLSAKDAFDEGFITELIDLNSEAAPTNLTGKSLKEVFAHYAKMNNSEKEESFLSRLAEKLSLKNTFTGNKPAPKTPTNNPENTDMKIKASARLVALLAIAGITAKEGEEHEVTAEHLEKITDEVDRLKGEAKTATDAKVAAEGQVATLKGEVTALQEKVNKVPGNAGTEAPDPNAEEGKTKDDEAPENNYLTAEDEEVRKLRAQRGVAKPATPKK